MRRSIIFLSVLLMVLMAGVVTVNAQTTHTVQAGENLYRIALKYGVSINSISQANGLSNANLIFTGQQLTIPGATGDTSGGDTTGDTGDTGDTTGDTGDSGDTTTPTGGTYTVQSGDTLGSIARNFGTTYVILAQINNIANLNLIFVGQVLTLPGGTTGGDTTDPAPPTDDPAPPTSDPAPTGGTYTVQGGDTLSTIARKFGTTYVVLAQINNIANPNVVSVGQVLTLPSGTTGGDTSGDTTSGGDTSGGTTPPPNTAPTSGFELGGQALSFSFPDQMRGAGMTWVKRQIHWNGGDPASNYQNVIDSAKGQGFRVLLSVIGDKGQIAANSSQYYQNYANFVGGLAAGGADAIEVWNEMNIDREWPSGLISGANYTQMLSAAYQAIKSQNSSTLVVSGAPAPTGFFQGCSAGGGDDDCYIRQMASAGASQFMDCVGIHYNSGIISPNATSGANVGSSGHYSWYYPSMVSLYSSVFPGKPLCFTELGYLTGEGIGALPGSFGWAAGNTLANQAEWLAGAVSRARQGGVRLLIVWNVDATGFGDDPQAGYAIVRPDGTCPACNSLRSAMGLN
jgi:LysM repeat protein